MTDADEIKHEDEIMLSFYSSKANSHASFVIAEIFGMYSLLVLISKDYLCWLIIAYVALLLLNAYSFLAFSYYSAISQSMLSRLAETEIKRQLTDVEKQMRGLTARALRVRNWVNADSRKTVILALLWFLGTTMPLIVISLNAH